MYCGTFGNGLYKSTNGFNTYVNILAGNLVIQDVNIDQQDTAKVFISEIDITNITWGLYYSTNGGNSFNLILPEFVNMIYNSPTSDSLFIATENGIFISPNNGSSWTNLYTGLNVKSITQHNGIVYAGLNTGEVFKAFPTYQNITGSWGTTGALFTVFNNDTLYVGLSSVEGDTTLTINGGIWYSSNFGITWNDITGNLSATHIFGGIAFSNNQIMVTPYTGGVFKTSSVLGIQTYNSMNEKLLIYPNPFSSSTTLQTDNFLHNATVTVDNCFGQTVKQIKNISGRTVTFSRDNLSSGLYFLRLTEENKTIAVDKLVITDK